jgi:hypothetical protein
MMQENNCRERPSDSLLSVEHAPFHAERMNVHLPDNIAPTADQLEPFR